MKNVSLMSGRSGMCVISKNKPLPLDFWELDTKAHLLTNTRLAILVGPKWW